MNDFGLSESGGIWKNPLRLTSDIVTIGTEECNLRNKEEMEHHGYQFKGEAGPGSVHK